MFFRITFLNKKKKLHWFYRVVGWNNVNNYPLLWLRPGSMNVSPSECAGICCRGCGQCEAVCCEAWRIGLPLQLLPWMIILPLGNTRGCCATSWHCILRSSMCHLLPSVILSPHSFFVLPATLLQSFQSLYVWRCALITQRDTVWSEWVVAGWEAHCVAHSIYWPGVRQPQPANVWIIIHVVGKQGFSMALLYTFTVTLR